MNDERPQRFQYKVKEGKLQKSLEKEKEGYFCDWADLLVSAVDVTRTCSSASTTLGEEGVLRGQSAVKGEATCNS